MELADDRGAKLAAMATTPEEAIRDAITGVTDLRALDAGGQGAVWRITRGGKPDVVKVVLNGDVARVHAEVAALQAVDSERVMKFRDVVALDLNGRAVPGIIGEFVDGGTIEDRLKAGTWPSELEALQCCRGVLEGIAAIHAVERVHRDIKPANVALRNSDWTRPVVLDLGLVRDLASPSITVYPQLVGTVPFMAPEQLRRERSVRKTDVFAVGVLLFLVLTEELPFVSLSKDSFTDEESLRRLMLERTASDDWPRWTRTPNLAADVAEVLARLLARDAHRRPNVARALGLIDELLDARS